MKDTIYLVLSSKRVERMTKNPPDLYQSELAVRVRVSVDDAAFMALIPTAVLEIPAESLLPPEFDAIVDTA